MTDLTSRRRPKVRGWRAGLSQETDSPQRSARMRWFGVLIGALRYGPPFALQLMFFDGTLFVAQIIATGHVDNRLQLLIGLLLVTLGLGAAEVHFRLYRRVWSVAGLSDAIALALAVVEACCIVTLVNLLTPVAYRPFPSVIPVLISPIVLSFVAVFRFSPRLMRKRPVAENRLLVVVPDASAYGTVKSLIQSSSSLWSVVAIVSESPMDTGHTLMGIPIVGSSRDLEHWVKVTNADGIAFVHGQVGQPEFRSLVATGLKVEKPIFVIPTPDELFRSPGMSRLRQLSADDLVTQPSHEMRLDGAAEVIEGKTVLVTGAAGSVGSELCRTLVHLNPRRLVLVDNNESGLFDLAAQLRTISTTDVKEELVSIKDRELLLTIFTDERPELVFHAAAYKHVPMLEAHPEQAFFVNVMGTRNVLWCAEAVSVRDFILISTDKAASTDSVMGCTKRLCELMVLSHGGPMRCRAVRFGNVVGSRGSVIPTFERQIQQGGPVTITHPEMTRYMMTSRQAAGLVIATVMLPSGHLYMLDMGDPIRILDIANALIRARGLRPGKDIEVIFTGLRPGERLSETLLGRGEGWRPTALASVSEIVTPMLATSEDLNWTIERLGELAQDQKTSDLVRSMRLAVTTGSHSGAEEPSLRVSLSETPKETSR